MRNIGIIIAKIEPDIYQRILEGSKTCEVRDEPFDYAEAIRYISSEDGSLLGVHRIGGEERIPRLQHTERLLRSLAGVGDETFDRLFPNRTPSHAQYLYVADIGERLDSVDDLFKDTDRAIRRSLEAKQ